MLAERQRQHGTRIGKANAGQSGIVCIGSLEFAAMFLDNSLRRFVQVARAGLIA